MWFQLNEASSHSACLLCVWTENVHNYMYVISESMERWELCQWILLDMFCVVRNLEYSCRTGLLLNHVHTCCNCIDIFGVLTGELFGSVAPVSADCLA